VQATRRSASVDFINAIAAKQKKQKNKKTKTKVIKATGLLSCAFTLSLFVAGSRFALSLHLMCDRVLTAFNCRRCRRRRRCHFELTTRLHAATALPPAMSNFFFVWIINESQLRPRQQQQQQQQQ